jgi:hypothetical protein
MLALLNGGEVCAFAIRRKIGAGNLSRQNMLNSA